MDRTAQSHQGIEDRGDVADGPHFRYAVQGRARKKLRLSNKMVLSKRFHTARRPCTEAHPAVQDGRRSSAAPCGCKTATCTE